jgi:hypothetical protein
MYEEHDSGVTDRSTARTRAKETHLKLVYQWAIQLANALEFVHSHSFEEPAPKISIISGDFNIDSCWLSSSGSSISLLGFLRSEFPHPELASASWRSWRPRSGIPTFC